MAIRIRFEKSANGKNAKKAKNGVSRGPSPRSGRRSARKPMGFARNGSLVWVLGGLLALLLALLMTAGVAPTTTGYREGDIALIDIKAPQDMRVEDGAATADLRRKAREGVRARYDIDSELQKSIESRSAAAFAAVRKEIASRSEVARKKAQQGEVARRGAGASADSRIYRAVVESPAFQAAEKDFVAASGGNLGPRTLDWLKRERFAGWIRNDLLKLVRSALSRGVVSDRQLYAAHAARGIIVRDIRTGKIVSLALSSEPLELREVEGYLRERAARLGLEGPPDSHSLLASLAARQVQPSLTFNNKATVQAQRRAEAQVGAVTRLFKRGEMIVREGERISKDQLDLLGKLEGAKTQDRIIDNLAGAGILIAIFLFFAWTCAKRLGLCVFADQKHLFLFVLLLATHAVLVKVSIVMSHFFSETTAAVDLTSFYYAIPFASAAMTAAILQGRSPAVLMSVMSAVVTFFLLPEQPQYAMVTLAGGIFCAMRWKSYRHRTAVFFAGLIVGLFNASLALGFNMQEGYQSVIAGWTDIPMAFLGGITNIILVSALLPLLESLFKLTTDMGLLELADQNHPLLRQLVVKAPGTYHHSLLVGNLAEEASEATGANPLLVRVGAYFHDIGKMLKPEYFVENQGAENRHDRLNPSMSALILISHVKDGVELARSHKLPAEIVDFILQHHGSSLIRFFYEKARATAKEGTEVPEEAYRYPGPRPQTREAGILMLADMVEAASRALEEPSPSRLAGMVERIVQGVLADGQLDECDLTLKNLARIREAFLRLLAGIHHHRIAYPEPHVDRRGTDGGIHVKPAKAGPDRLAHAEAAGRGIAGKPAVGR